MRVQVLVALCILGSSFYSAYALEEIQDSNSPWLAYIKDGDIWLMQVGNIPGEPIASGDVFVDFDWSPNGQFILAGTEDNSFRIIDPLLKTTVDIPKGCHPPNGQEIGNAWSPDGNNILLECYGDAWEGAATLVIDVDGQTISEFIHPFGFARSWGQNGQDIYYFESESSLAIGTYQRYNVFTGVDESILDIGSLLPYGRLAIIQPGSTTPWSALFTKDGFEDHGGGFMQYRLSFLSEDGTHILYPYDDLDCMNQCIPGENVRVSYGPGGNWSPVENKYAFFPEETLINQNEHPSLVIYDVETNEHLVPWEHGGLNPDWSPDGKYISLTTRNGGLVTIDLDSGISKQLISDAPRDALKEYLRNSFSDTSGEFYASPEMESAWSPNGEYLLFTYPYGFYIVDSNGYDMEWVEGGIRPKWQSTGNSLMDDLRVEILNLEYKLENPGSIELVWTAPDKDVTQYEGRYLDEPIHEGNWDDTYEIDHPPDPASPGHTHRWNIDSMKLDPYKKWYLAIRAQHEDGSWSHISNIAEWVDTGFRSYPNGYQDENTYQTDKYELTIQQIQDMFGTEIVCRNEPNLFEDCELTLLAWDFRGRVNDKWECGVCTGMASTSMHYYKDKIDPSSLDQAADTIYDLRLQEQKVRSNIVFFHTAQWANPILQQRRIRQEQSNPSAVIVQLMAAMVEGWKDPQILVLTSADGCKQHTVTPYAISSIPDGRWRIWVYDNNLGFHSVEIDIKNNEWGISGQSIPNSIHLLELSLFTEDLSLPSFLDQIRIGLLGTGFLRIEDVLGNISGFLNNQCTNNIPEAESLPTNCDGQGEYSPDYFLPVDGKYEVTIEGNDQYVGQKSSLIVNFPSYFLILDRLELTDGIRHRVWLDPASKITTFTPNMNVQIEASILVPSEKDDREFVFANLGIPHNGEITFRRHEDSVVVTRSSSANIGYDLKVVFRDVRGEYLYTLADAQLGDGQTQIFNLSESDDGQPILQVDEDGDGVFDVTKQLEKQPGTSTEILSRIGSNPGIFFLLIGSAFLIIGIVGFFVIRRKVH